MSSNQVTDKDTCKLKQPINVRDPFYPITPSLFSVSVLPLGQQTDKRRGVGKWISVLVQSSVYNSKGQVGEGRRMEWELRFIKY